jgi:hypothetical protein
MDIMPIPNAIESTVIEKRKGVPAIFIIIDSRSFNIVLELSC